MSDTNFLRETKDKHEEVEEEWGNCEEQERGGFGAVHRQMEKTTGCYRGVKTIHKRMPLKLDYYRKLFVIGILVKVCGLAPKKLSQLTPAGFRMV